MNVTRLMVLILGITLILMPIACGGGGSDAEDKKPALQQEAESSVKSSAAPTPPAATAAPPAATAAPPAALTPQEGSVQQEQSSKQDLVTLTDVEKIFSVAIPSSWTASMDDDLMSLDFFEGFYNEGILPLFFGVDENSGSNLFILSDFKALLSEEPLPIDGNAYADFQQTDLEAQPNYQGGMSSSKIVVDGILTTELRWDMFGGMKQIAYVMTSNEPRMGCGSMGILLIGTIATDAEALVIENAMASVKILPAAALSDDCDNRRALSALHLFPNVTTDSASGTQDEVIEADGLWLLEWEPVEDVMGDVGVVGVIENISDELKEFVYVTFDAYDKEGYSLGQVEAVTERLQSGRKWKFEATSVIDADEVEVIELFSMGTW